MDALTLVAPFFGITAGAGFGIAAIVRAFYFGRATVIRAKRGDPEPILPPSLLERLLSRGRGDN